MFKRNRNGYVVPTIETGSFLKNLRKIMFAGWGLSSCIAKTAVGGARDNLCNIKMIDVISLYYAQIRSTHLSCRLRSGGNLSPHSGQIISSKLACLQNDEGLYVFRSIFNSEPESRSFTDIGDREGARLANESQKAKSPRSDEAEDEISSELGYSHIQRWIARLCISSQLGCKGAWLTTASDRVHNPWQLR
jgi:hypothetical protein